MSFYCFFAVKIYNIPVKIIALFHALFWCTTLAKIKPLLPMHGNMVWGNKTLMPKKIIKINNNKNTNPKNCPCKIFMMRHLYP